MITGREEKGERGKKGGWRERERDHAAIKKKGILPFVSTWMNLKVIILSKISQKEKDK